jgi:hypothetical protein
MVYVVGVSSGFFGVAEARERPELAGLFKKAQTSITKGVNFVQLDLESTAEFEEPNLKEKMKKDIREKLGVSYGIHSETKAAGVEAAELDSAIAFEYKRAHKRIVEILRKSKEIDSKYVLVHSSESEPFPLLERILQTCDLVDFYGRSLSDFLKENKDLLDWVLGGKKEEIVNSVLEVWKEKGEKITIEDIIATFAKRKIFPKNFIIGEIWRGATLEGILHSIIVTIVSREEHYRRKLFKEFSSEEKEEVLRLLTEELKREVERMPSELIEFVRSKGLHYGPERIAYYFIAKWMELHKDPLWEKIVKAAITFFSAREKKSIEEWLKENNLSLERLTIDDENFRARYELWVPAVSAKYIFGHFFPISVEYEDPKKYLDPMIFALESPFGGRGIEEWYRLSNPYLYYFLVEEVNKTANKEIFAVALDLEHMLSSKIDPELVAELWPEEGGKFIRVIHAGWPSTLAPAHLPIKLGSRAQEYLYKVYYKFRLKGFGKDPKKECWIIFERGPPETFMDSVLALKTIVEFLEKDVPPEKLPLEFYGISPTGVFAEERQLATIKEHAYEPLRDLLVLPEEIHGLFGRAAIEKGVSPEKWKKEELR